VAKGKSSRESFFTFTFCLFTSALPSLALNNQLGGRQHGGHATVLPAAARTAHTALAWSAFLSARTAD
jgi:hypothetical protein